MHVLAIDVGSYSVKYFSSFVERRKTSHVDMSEVVINDYLVDHPELTLRGAQLNIIQEIIDEVARADSRIIFQAPNDFMTTRFLTLPTKKKKVADRMLPFNLEEDLPYALSEVHYAYRMEKQKTQFTAIVELVRENNFAEYYEALRDKSSLPHVLTSESSVIENYFHLNPVAGPFCVLDIGHRTTKAYFFFNSRLMVTHVSYLGGHHINEMISDSYKINGEEAVNYKHQNAFLLTSSQYEEVEPAQKDFAHAMDKVFTTLVSDFTRWNIGFKVNFGLSATQVFICGGTSNLKNITSYLSEKWDVKVSPLESFDQVETGRLNLDQKGRARFSLSNMMVQGYKQKNRFINLLTGRFAQAGLAELPLHSIGFIGVRVVAASLILGVSLLAENYFLNQDIKFVNTKITGLMKNDELAIPARLGRQIAVNPQPVYDHLVKRQRGVRQEISTMQSAIDIQALSPLVKISQIASTTEGTLTNFSSNDMGEIKATFTAANGADLTKIQQAFEASGLSDVSAIVDEKQLSVNVTASGK
jgi:general secretion pathway protein L